MTTTKDLIAYLDHSLTLDDVEGLCPEQRRKLTSLLYHWADFVDRERSSAGVEASESNCRGYDTDCIDAIALAREATERLDALFHSIQSEVACLERSHHKAIGVPEAILSTFRPSSLSRLVALGCDTASQWASHFHDMAREHQAKDC